MRGVNYVQTDESLQVGPWLSVKLCQAMNECRELRDTGLQLIPSVPHTGCCLDFLLSILLPYTLRQCPPADCEMLGWMPGFEAILDSYC